MKTKVHGEPLLTARAFSVQGEAGGEWFIPEEVPVAFVYNRRNYAVMMASPSDIIDFAVGFSLTENVVSAPDDIESLDIYNSDQGIDCRFQVSDERVDKLDVTLRRRNMVGSASCGLCGLENADVLFRKLPRVSGQPVKLNPQSITKAIESLSEYQPLNQLTRTVHAAAWVENNGTIVSVREDVGRHNALDKLLGHLALQNVDKSDGFVLMSSRCSYEIVEKAATQGVKAIVSVSAPTAFALRKAKEANMAIYSRSGEGAVRLL